MVNTREARARSDFLGNVHLYKRGAQFFVPTSTHPQRGRAATSSREPPPGPRSCLS